MLHDSAICKFTIDIDIADVVASTGGTVVLVGQDGVQRPPVHFPKGGHLLAFLSCLENGLLPRGQLDPPLWSQRDKGADRFLLHAVTGANPGIAKGGVSHLPFLSPSPLPYLSPSLPPSL